MEVQKVNFPTFDRGPHIFFEPTQFNTIRFPSILGSPVNLKREIYPMCLFVARTISLPQETLLFEKIVI